MIKFVADVECVDCGGTGIYQGSLEKNDSGVICKSCSGSGCRTVRYSFNQFKGRVKHPSVKRVYQTSGGFEITSEKVITKAGLHIDFSKAGCSLEEWEQGKEPLPIYDLHCPYIHYRETNKSSIAIQVCCENLRGLESVNDCSKKNKLSCWSLFNIYFNKIKR